MTAPDTRHDWISTEEAAVRLGVSQSTVRTMIREGRLVSERVERPQGTRLLVRFDHPAQAQEDAQPAPSDAQAATAAILALSERLAAQDATVADQATRIAALERENGTLGERAANAQARADDLGTTLEAARADLGALRERADRLLAEKEQWALEAGEQTERAMRAEAELAQLRSRRPWWRWW